MRSGITACERLTFFLKSLKNVALAMH